MRKKSFKLNNVQLNSSKTKGSLLDKKKKKNTEIIAKFAQLLLLIFLVGVIIYATITI